MKTAKMNKKEFKMDKLFESTLQKTRQANN